MPNSTKVCTTSVLPNTSNKCSFLIPQIIVICSPDFFPVNEGPISITIDFQNLYQYSFLNNKLNLIK